MGDRAGMKFTIFTLMKFTFAANVAFWATVNLPGKVFVAGVLLGVLGTMVLGIMQFFLPPKPGPDPPIARVMGVFLGCAAGGILGAILLVVYALWIRSDDGASLEACLVFLKACASLGAGVGFAFPDLHGKMRGIIGAILSLLPF